MERLIHIPVDGITLEGALNIPQNAMGLVLFAHGSGSSRHSPRNIAVARELQRVGIATLLIDLLSEEEDEDYETRFNIELLSNRLVTIIDWLRIQANTKDLSLALFGASTGAAAALFAAHEREQEISAVVSRGGRPDLAMSVLPDLEVPVLLIVGGNDTEVLELNRSAYNALRCARELYVVPGATHLFEERGALEEVSRLAKAWFLWHLKRQEVFA